MSVTTLPGNDTIQCTNGMQARIGGNPDFGYLSCTLPPDQPLLVESGAMAAMSDGFEVRNRLLGLSEGQTSLADEISPMSKRLLMQHQRSRSSSTACSSRLRF